MNILKVAMVVLTTAIGAAGCRPSSPEEALRKAVDEVVAAVREGDAGDLKDITAQGFRTGSGWDRQTLYRFAVIQFLRYPDVYLLLTDKEIVLNPDDPARALVTGTAALAGGQSPVPSSARLYRFEAQWRRIEDRWRLWRLDWR